MKKMISLALAVLMLLSVSIAFAKTVTPDDEYKGLAGVVVNATVGEYNPDSKTFTVTLYKDDSFAIDDVEKLAPGDVLLAGGWTCRVKEKTEDENGEIKVLTEDGGEIIFVQVGDDQRGKAIVIVFVNYREMMLHAIPVPRVKTGLTHIEAVRRGFHILRRRFLTRYSADIIYRITIC